MIPGYGHAPELRSGSFDQSMRNIEEFWQNSSRKDTLEYTERYLSGHN